MQDANSYFAEMNEAIETLATEAVANGDHEQVKLCRLALATGSFAKRLAREIKRAGPSDAAIGVLYQTPLYRAYKRASAARSECARVIADATKAQG